MPTAKKIAWAQLKVGILVIVAMIIVGTLVFLLTGEKKLFSKDATLYTYMEDSAAMTKGAAVRLNGVLIGQVQSVELSGEKQPRRTIKLVMGVEKDRLAQIPSDSVAAISAENVLGSKFINIKRGTASTTVQDGQEIQAQDTTNFDDLVQSGNNLLVELQSIVKRVDAVTALVEVGKGTIGKLLVDEELYNRANRIADDVERLTKSINTPNGTIGKLINDDALYNDVRKSIARLDAVVADIQSGQGTAGKFIKDPALYDESRQAIAEMRKLLADLNAGKGSAGKLLKSDEMHRQIQGTIARLDRMLDKVNSGQGTIGQLLVNQQLYESMNGATVELKGLLKDFRSDPKKFLRIKLAIF
jgi:phospholipid/cholesterol/gamma-HCH transport system substrate-binding protein